MGIRAVDKGMLRPLILIFELIINIFLSKALDQGDLYKIDFELNIII